jgi:hypothetical protein
MKQSRFSLADVLTVLAAAVFGFFCFLSTNFFTLGNTKQSIILAIIIAVLLGGAALGAKLLKRTSRNFKTRFIWEMILLVLFVVFAVFFARSPFPHYFAVSSQKEDIQNKLTASITQAERMFALYEQYAENRENLYKSKLESVVNSKSTNPSEYAEYGFVDDVSDTTQIENKMFTIHADLFPSNFVEMKQVYSTWLANARKIVTQWKPIGIVNVTNDVEQKSEEWLAKLVQFSTVREKGEEVEDFSYDLSFDDVKKYFTTLGNHTPLSIGLVILAYVLMLLSWFITKRSTKTTIGTKTNKGKYDIDY